MLGIFNGTVSIQSISYLFYFESWRVNEGKMKSRKHVKDEFICERMYKWPGRFDILSKNNKYFYTFLRSRIISKLPSARYHTMCLVNIIAKYHSNPKREI